MPSEIAAVSAPRQRGFVPLALPLSQNAAQATSCAEVAPQNLSDCAGEVALSREATAAVKRERGSEDVNWPFSECAIPKEMYADWITNDKKIIACCRGER
jgi:hypothetical protein